MGLFDKLFGKISKIKDGHTQEYYSPETVEDAQVSEQAPDGGQDSYADPTENSAGVYDTAGSTQAEPCDLDIAQQTEVPREEYLSRFRADFRHHFPKSLDTVESHMQLPYMIGSAVDISPVIEYAKSDVYSRFVDDPDKLSELSRAAVAKVAMNLEQYIASCTPEPFMISVKRAHTESLEKAWIVLDFYCRMLKGDYTLNIGILYIMISDELITRVSNPVAIAQSESYEDVLARCSKLISEDSDSDEIPALKKRLFEKLLNLDSLYLIHDETFNNAFPYIGADGRLEMQTNADRAESLTRFLEKNGDSKVSVTEYKQEEYEKLFTKLLHHGLTVIRLDNGLTPVEIDISGLYDSGEKNLIEVCNRYARRMFISELQYGYRLKELLGDRRDSEDYRILSSAMLKARTDGYRALAGGLVYVFNIGGAKPGTTLYTPKAMETAAEIMKVMGVVDSNTLIAPYDSTYEVFTGEIALRSIQRKDSTPDKGFVCAFTDRENADKIHQRFTNAGASDAVLVMTLGELCRNCRDCAGFILDMSSYGLEVPCELFGSISECARTEGILVGGQSV